MESKTGVVVGLVSISTFKEQVACADAGLFTRIGSYLDFISANLGERGFDDGDNQRVKDEARPGILAKFKGRCEKHYSGKAKECEDAVWANNNLQWEDLIKASGQCQPLKAMGSACRGCVADDIPLDSTLELVIQCAEAAGQKAN